MTAANASPLTPCPDRCARLAGPLSRLLGVVVAFAGGLYLWVRKGVRAARAERGFRPLPHREGRVFRPGFGNDGPSLSGPQRVRARRSLCRQGPPAPSHDGPRLSHGVFGVARPC